MNIPRPKFDNLPLRQGDPKCSAWGLWGSDDELGTLNLITEDIRRAAALEVKLGKAINLNLPLNVPLKPMNPRRKPCAHTLIPKEHANDDEFYNGVTQEDISDIATHPIATRGVLLDWYSYAIKHNIPHTPFTNQHIPLSQLLIVAQEEGVTFRKGDVLLIRTGWTDAYYKLSEEEKDKLGGRDDRASIGVEATEECIRWHWEHEFAAVASDTVAYEAWPSPKSWGVCMHEVFLSGWGMPIGECWDLEELSATCAKVSRWTFMLTSQPLYLPGGVASPPNAIAIF
ncbi:Putative cyclase [Penicillium occitanis (nom. inval.)]|nr:Putative cyclase [Penicillium occitanis (nom. inval.)]PCG96442.1 hypothetical protein PENOC_072750 [Penicillium occitanis (nom. inval.)]